MSVKWVVVVGGHINNSYPIGTFGAMKFMCKVLITPGTQAFLRGSLRLGQHRAHGDAAPDFQEMRCALSSLSSGPLPTEQEGGMMLLRDRRTDSARAGGEAASCRLSTLTNQGLSLRTKLGARAGATEGRREMFRRVLGYTEEKRGPGSQIFLSEKLILQICLKIYQMIQQFHLLGIYPKESQAES